LEFFCPNWFFVCIYSSVIQLFPDTVISFREKKQTIRNFHTKHLFLFYYSKSTSNKPLLPLMTRHILALLTFFTLVHLYHFSSLPPPPKIPSVSFLYQTDYHSRGVYHLYLHLDVNIHRLVLQRTILGSILHL